MSTNKDTLLDMFPHTAAKHEILRRYLQAWMPILGSTQKRLFYVDGYAGPGAYKTGEPGSPIIALECALEAQDRIKAEVLFLFIEEREDRGVHLQGLIDKMDLPDHFRVKVEQDRFERRMRVAMDRLKGSLGGLPPRSRWSIPSAGTPPWRSWPRSSSTGAARSSSTSCTRL